MDTAAALVAAAERLALKRGSVNDAAIRREAARRVRRGVFCMHASLRPSFEESVVAALMVLPPGSLACGLTAARLWRLDALVPVTPDEPLEFLVPDRRGSIRLADCRLQFEGFTTVGLPMGIPATSAERTIIDVIDRMPFADAVAMVEAALRNDPTAAPALATERQRRVPRRGREFVERVLDFADALSESVLESHARVVWATNGLPAPIQQATIRVDGRFVARVDFLWPGARLIVEVDGLGKYNEPGVLQQEKQRQNKLIAAGYTVLRFTWSDIHHRPDDVVRLIRSALRATA